MPFSENVEKYRRVANEGYVKAMDEWNRKYLLRKIAKTKKSLTKLIICSSVMTVSTTIILTYVQRHKF